MLSRSRPRCDHSRCHASHAGRWPAPEIHSKPNRSPTRGSVCGYVSKVWGPKNIQKPWVSNPRISTMSGGCGGPLILNVGRWWILLPREVCARLTVRFAGLGSGKRTRIIHGCHGSYLALAPWTRHSLQVWVTSASSNSDPTAHQTNLYQILASDNLTMTHQAELEPQHVTCCVVNPSAPCFDLGCQLPPLPWAAPSPLCPGISEPDETSDPTEAPTRWPPRCEARPAGHRVHWLRSRCSSPHVSSLWVERNGIFS